MAILTYTPVFVFLGQSQMSGNGVVSELGDYIDDELTDVKILHPSFTNGFENHRPNRSNENQSTQFGGDWKCANLLRNYIAQDIYFIKYAAPNTQLADDGDTNATTWYPVDAGNGVGGSYTTADDLIDEGMLLLRNEGLRPKIIAYVWYQGDNDRAEARRDLYRENLQLLINTRRAKDLANDYAYELDGAAYWVICGQNPHEVFNAGEDVIEEAKKQVVADLDKTIFARLREVDVPTVAEGGDGTHPLTRGNLHVGSIIADKLRQIPFNLVIR